MLLTRESAYGSPRKAHGLSVSLGQPLVDPLVHAEAGREAYHDSSSTIDIRVLTRRPLRRFLAVIVFLSAPSGIVPLPANESQ